MIGFKELLLILLIILLIFGAGKLPSALKSIMQSVKDLQKKDKD